MDANMMLAFLSMFCGGVSLGFLVWSAMEKRRTWALLFAAMTIYNVALALVLAA